jgi:hypothetical protein
MSLPLLNRLEVSNTSQTRFAASRTHEARNPSPSLGQVWHELGAEQREQHSVGAAWSDMRNTCSTQSGESDAGIVGAMW